MLTVPEIYLPEILSTRLDSRYQSVEATTLELQFTFDVISMSSSVQTGDTKIVTMTSSEMDSSRDMSYQLGLMVVSNLLLNSSVL